MALGSAPKHEHIIAINYVKMINSQFGTTLAPWEVDSIPQDWLNTIAKFTSDYPMLKQGLAKAQKIVDDIKRNHPTYGKRMH